jgi:hypothetical protein
MANPKLKVDVNHNPTKKGIKVQFVFPNILQGDEKDALSQKLQQKNYLHLSINYYKFVKIDYLTNKQR